MRGGVVTVGQQPVGKRRECHQADTQFLQHGEQGFVPACHHRIAVLHGSERTDGVGTADVLLRGFRKSPIKHLPLLYQVLYHACNLFYRYIRVRTMLIIKVDMVRL